MVENPYLKRVFDLIGAKKKNEQKSVDSSNLLQKPLTTRRLFTSQQPQIPSQKPQIPRQTTVQEPKKSFDFGEYYKSQLSKAKEVGKEMVKETVKAPFRIAKSLYYVPPSMKQGLQGTYQGEPEWKIPLLGNITSYQEGALKRKEDLMKQGFDEKTATVATILGVGGESMIDIAMVGLS